MTNKIEKLNARLVNDSRQLEFDLAKMSSARVIDVYERNKPGLIKAIKRVSEKIDEVIDESNRNTKSIDALSGTFCALEKYIFKLEARINKLEAAQKQEQIDNHPAKGILNKIVDIVAKEEADKQEKEAEKTLKQDIDSDLYLAWAIHPAKIDCRNIKCKFHCICNICGHVSPAITLCNSVGICYNKKEDDKN